MTAVPIDHRPAADLFVVLRHIPDEHRTFKLTAAAAEAEFQLDAGTLAALVASGLPHRAGRYDRRDLHNAVLHLGLNTAVRAARRFWAAGLLRPPSPTPVRYEIYYQARCPAPGHPGTCAYTVAVPGGTIDRALPPGAHGPVHAQEVALATAWPAVTPAVAELADAARSLRFMYLPPALKGDLTFIRRTGLADCIGTMALLVAEGRRRGLPVRTAHGIIVSPPYSTTHNWAEVRIEDRWVPIDPVLVGLMVSWGLLDPAQWPGARSPGAILARLTDRPRAFVAHGGKPVPVSLPTRRLRGS